MAGTFTTCICSLLGILVWGAGANKSIELNPPSVVVKYGDPVTANCTVFTHHLGMGWVAPQNPVELQTGVQSVLWNVTSLTTWDAKPQCYANIKGKPQLIQLLPVTVYKTPDNVSISINNHPDPLEEGGQYQLGCKVLSVAPAQNLSVKWYKGSEIVSITHSLNDSKTPVSVSSSLTISPNRTDNGAQYKCVAELDLGPEGPQPPPVMESEPLRITVHYPPRITACDDHMELREGNLLNATTCNVDSNPEHEVTWQKDKKEVNGSLTLTRENMGLYVFIAKNAIGSDNKTVSITVGYAPELICPLIYGLKENETLKAVCTAVANPEPTITWLKDGKEVNRTAALTKMDGGQYTATASNIYGSVSRTLDIKVFGANESFIEINPSSVVVRYGDPVTANCTVFTHHLGMGWVASQNPVELQTGVQSVLWNVTSLTTWDARPQCFANIKGKPQLIQLLPVTVYKTPDNVAISINNHPDALEEGGQYQLGCKVLNVAPAQNLNVKWYKGSEIVSITRSPNDSKTSVSVSSSLTINPNRTDNGAQYKCVAELDLGPEGPQPLPAMDSQSLTITVHYKPEFLFKYNGSVPVVQGFTEVLQCIAKGNPSPTVFWHFKGKALGIGKGSYNITIRGEEKYAGNYTCTANNSMDTISFDVTVDLIEDYGPLITILIVVIAVLSLIIIGLIYCIYYKNTKTGHYDLKDINQCTQNGYVAHNDKNGNFPMTVLSIWA